MNLNDLLISRGIDPRRVLVFRHRPSEPELNRALPWLAAERPEVFNAYQQTQGDRLEGVMEAMKENGFIASFLGREPGKALFVGLYAIAGSRDLTYQEYWQVPAHAVLKSLGQKLQMEMDRASQRWFDLKITDFYTQWKGRLVVSWPPPERSWWRRAHRNEFTVLAIHEDSVLDAAMPDWDAIDITWDELALLPSRWKSALAQWRGIYYIFDSSDGKGYVGSAYGESNLLGRWLNYAASGHGGNALLKKRKPQHFRFTILERVSPDMEPADVIRLESSWKQRLHTRAPYGMNDN
jgi:hypothetical protein